MDRSEWKNEMKSNWNAGGMDGRVMVAKAKREITKNYTDSGNSETDLEVTKDCIIDHPENNLKQKRNTEKWKEPPDSGESDKL